MSSSDSFHLMFCPLSSYYLHHNGPQRITAPIFILSQKSQHNFSWFSSVQLGRHTIYIYFFGCFGSSLLRVVSLQLRRARATLHCGARASHCGGFSCCRVWAVECRLSSCGARAQFLCGMWDLPRPRIEPVSPALTSRFLTIAPPGKPQTYIFLKIVFHSMYRNTKLSNEKSKAMKCLASLSA